MALTSSTDGTQLRWSCEYCLDPEPSGWLDPTPDTRSFFTAVERSHFAHQHAPVDLKDLVLREGITPELARQATYEAAVRATEREQREAKILLGITTEETT